ncbi:MAG: hypothetical protein PHE84_14895 [bacterium]|nr:hypothetical protein [bacterium]
MARAIISFFIAMPLAVLINVWLWPGTHFWQVALLVCEYVILYLIVYNSLSLFSPRAEEK